MDGKEIFVNKVKYFLGIFMEDKQWSYNDLITALINRFDCSIGKAKSAFSRLRTENYIKKENGRYSLAN